MSHEQVIHCPSDQRLRVASTFTQFGVTGSNDPVTNPAGRIDRKGYATANTQKEAQEPLVASLLLVKTSGETLTPIHLKIFTGKRLLVSQAQYTRQSPARQRGARKQDVLHLCVNLLVCTRWSSLPMSRQKTQLFDALLHFALENIFSNLHMFLHFSLHVLFENTLFFSLNLLKISTSCSVRCFSPLFTGTHPPAHLHRLLQPDLKTS